MTMYNPNLFDSPLQAKIFNLLCEEGPMRRGHPGRIQGKHYEVKEDLGKDTLCGALNRARTTIFDTLQKLERKGLVKHYREPKEEHKKGRPKILWEAI